MALVTAWILTKKLQLCDGIINEIVLGSTHSLAFSCVLLHCGGLSQILLHSLEVSCNRMSSLAFSCVLLHFRGLAQLLLRSLAVSCGLLHSLAFPCVVLRSVALCCVLVGIHFWVQRPPLQIHIRFLERNNASKTCETCKTCKTWQRAQFVCACCVRQSRIVATPFVFTLAR